MESLQRNQNYRAANSQTPVVTNNSHVGAPPPYSAIVPGPSAPRPQVPPHGFGEGRGPNRNKGKDTFDSDCKKISC